MALRPARWGLEAGSDEEYDMTASVQRLSLPGEHQVA